MPPVAPRQPPLLSPYPQQLWDFLTPGIDPHSGPELNAFPGEVFPGEVFPREVSLRDTSLGEVLLGETFLEEPFLLPMEPFLLPRPKADAGQLGWHHTSLELLPGCPSPRAGAERVC